MKKPLMEDNQSIIDRFPLPYQSTDAKASIIYVNKAWLDLLGYSRKEVINKWFGDFLTLDSANLFKKRFPMFLTEGKVHGVEYTLIGKDGRELTVSFDGNIEFDEKNQFIRTHCFFKDITEQKQIMQSFQEGEERWQTMLASSPDYILMLDSDLKIEFSNRASPGLTIDELIGKQMYDFVAKDKRSEIKGVLEKVLKTGEPAIYETQYSPPDGSTIFYETKAVQRTIDGYVIGLTLNSRDITERKHAEEEIRRLSKFPDENPSPILRFSKEGKILYTNRNSAALLNKWGRSAGESAPPDWKKSISNSFASGEILEIENNIEDRTFSFILTPIKEMDYVNAYGRDITERVRAEQLLNALNRASVAMGAAMTHQEIFDTIAEELKQLDISCMIILMDETQSKVAIEYLSLESKAIKAAEKLAGIKKADFFMPINSVDYLREVIREKKTLFTSKTEEILSQALPKITKKILAQVVKLLHIQRSISVPLIVEDQVIGIFSIQSNNLTQEDVPAATAFADQLSSAWNKIELLQNLQKTVEGAIHTIAATVEARDPYTAGHQTRVADLATAIASEMHLSKDQVEGIRMAGIIHDLGKINVPAEILSKPGKLNELEFQIIQIHPQVGFDLLKEIEFPWPIAKMVLQHHEKMDGSGYPQGLNGKEIMIEARILAVADTVEAMSSHRPYRPALGIEKALGQIKKEKGTLFDPDGVDACLKVFEDGYNLPDDQNIQISD